MEHLLLTTTDCTRVSKRLRGLRSRTPLCWTSLLLEMECTPSVSSAAWRGTDTCRPSVRFPVTSLYDGDDGRYRGRGAGCHQDAGLRRQLPRARRAGRPEPAPPPRQLLGLPQHQHRQPGHAAQGERPVIKMVFNLYDIYVDIQLKQVNTFTESKCNDG